MNNTVIHQLSLVGIGGVQQSFIPYFKMAIDESEFKHYVYGMHKLDRYYNSIGKFYYNINGSILNKIKFIYYIYSRNHIIHFYNNLGSRSVNRILRLFPSNKIIFHERGTAWNASDNDVEIFSKNAKYASVILANSYATKIMLVKRFEIPEEKIKVIYNGFLSGKSKFDIREQKRFSSRFCVGYIGRLDTPKGVHIFIEAAKKLIHYDFYIAGNGAWSDSLKSLASGYDNIHFIGRVKDPLEFISSMDLMVVPSIREPLGNIIIEAGFCKKPVVAANVDGISELIEHNHSGVLLEPKKKLSFNNIPDGAVPVPSCIVNPRTLELEEPKEIDIEELCSSITELENNVRLRDVYGSKLYEKVSTSFTVENYFNKLEDIYREIQTQ